MKVTLDKKVFNLDETEVIKQFKTEWTTPTMNDIKSAVKVTAVRLNIDSAKLIAVNEKDCRSKNRKTMLL